MLSLCPLSTRPSANKATPDVASPMAKKTRTAANQAIFCLLGRYAGPFPTFPPQSTPALSDREQ
jgi:hypothetical protein